MFEEGSLTDNEVTVGHADGSQVRSLKLFHKPYGKLKFLEHFKNGETLKKL